MRFLRQNTAVRITVGPFLDKTDGVTPETALTVTNCKITLMVDDDDNTAANLIIDAAATASGGDNDMVHVTNDDAGFYDLKLTAAQTNYLGRALLAITDAANHCPVFHEFMIVSQGLYDKLFGAYSTTRGLAGTALPNAAADTAGGLPISDAGGLDLDTLLARLDATVSSRGTSTLTQTQVSGGAYDLTHATYIAALKAGLGTIPASGNWAVAGDAMSLTAGERTTLAAAIEAAIINELDGKAVMQAIADLIASDMTTTDLTVAAIAAACRDAILNRVLAGNHDGAGTAGLLLQKLNVSGTLAHSDAAATYKADVSPLTNVTYGLSALQALIAAIPTNPYTGTPPTVGQIRTEMETAGGTLALAKSAADTAATQAAAAAASAAAVQAKLPTKAKITGTANSDGDIQLDEATGAFTEAALANTPAAAGGSDWTAGEKTQIRQALGLTGTTAATSGSGNLDLVKTQTDKIGGSSTTVQSPVSEEDIEIVAGDSYTAAQPLQVIKTNWSGPSMSGGTVRLRIVAAASYEAGTDTTPALEITGTISQSGQTVTCNFPLTAAQTAGLTTTEPPGDKYPYVYQVVGTTSASVVRTLAVGGFNVRRRVPASA